VGGGAQIVSSRVEAGSKPDADSRVDAAATVDSGSTADAGSSVDLADAPSDGAGDIQGLLVSGPELESFAEAPLARKLCITTAEPTTVEVVVKRDDRVRWQRHFDSPSTSHALPLLGFLPDETYSVEVILHTSREGSVAIPEPLTITTDPLPDDWPPIHILTSKPEEMEPGYTLFSVQTRTGEKHYTLVLNEEGETVWYTELRTNELRQVSDGNILFIGEGEPRLMDMYGQIVHRWPDARHATPAPGSTPVDISVFHHELFPMENGNFLSLSRELEDLPQFPNSYTDLDSTAPATVVNDLVVEFVPETGEVLHRYAMHDLLDTGRIGYESLNEKYGGFDWGHTNAVIHVPSDDTYIVSVRFQDAVIKMSRQTGAIIWILGPHGNWAPEFRRYLLTPWGSPFEWPYHSHAPQVTDAGTLMLFDNGSQRALPPDPAQPLEDRYSRAVEYEIDEEAMTVSQVWSYGSDSDGRLYARMVGDADVLPQTGNVLITFGGLTYIDGKPVDTEEEHSYAAHIIEVTHDAKQETLFDVFIDDGIDGEGGWSVARATRFSSLYGD
jgi:arylsulfate sulfotransferase